MPNINEKVFIELYLQGKGSAELSQLLGIPKRTVEAYEEQLRIARKIPYRKNLPNASVNQQKTRFTATEIVPFVEEYVNTIQKTHEKYNDIYKNVKYKGVWKRDKQTEDMVNMLSDMHTGMINKAPITGEITYNDGIQQIELQNLLKGVQRFYQLYSPVYNIETFYIFGLGDLITNDRIFEGQVSEITCGVGMQIQKAFYYVSEYIKNCLELFPRVVYINIVGNHGRTTSKYMTEDATSNFEHFIGLLLQERFKDNKRVEIINPDDYALNYEIRGHKYLLTHGNWIRGGSLNTIEQAVKNLSLLVENEPYDVITIGHFHSCYEFPISPATTLLVNGCFIERDSYAYTQLKKFSTAKQFLFNVSKKSPLHNLQKIDLRWDFTK